MEREEVGTEQKWKEYKRMEKRKKERTHRKKKGIEKEEKTSCLRKQSSS
tara:strand:- start:285 stop:431 length:147 start_codon:yes stop_codon:yes gene_type:complete